MGMLKGAASLRLIRVAVASLTLTIIAAATANAQVGLSELRIRVETGADEPLSGALIALLDSAGRTVAEGLSSPAGIRVLHAPVGSYQVRVRRIGFRPYLSEFVLLPREKEMRLRVESAPVVLSAVVVATHSQCRVLSEGGGSLATVWDEIAKALRATELTAADAATLGRPRVYRKQVTSDGRVATTDTTLLRAGAHRPFRAMNPSALSTLGYVIGDEISGWEFFGVDETTLLSGGFRNTHCFRVVRDRSRPGQIGLAFDPVPRRPVSDVAGTLWLDERTAELRELTYRYTGAGPISDYGGSGYTRFRRMPSGVWIVDEWWLRVPWLQRRMQPVPRIVPMGYVEHGGDLIPPDGA